MVQGILRRDIDQRLILLIYSKAVEDIINPEMLSQLPFTTTKVFETIVKVLFDGILTDEAKPAYLSEQRST